MAQVNRRGVSAFQQIMLLVLVSLVAVSTGEAQSCPAGGKSVSADVIALDQPFMLNRLGAAMPQGMVFALKSDVVDKATQRSCSTMACQPGQVQLRADKRPRPMVLRLNQGQCLSIRLTNLLALQPTSQFQPVTRAVSIHVNGMQLVSTITDDGSLVGANASGLVAPSATIFRVYNLYAKAQGSFLLYSMGSSFGFDGQGGQITDGLFGTVTVEPPQAEYYRSQVTRDDLLLAVDRSKGSGGFTPDGQPIINYQAVYPPGHPRAGQPILRMVATNGVTFYTDLTAIITGPNAGRFPANQTGPEFNPIPASPDRREPFREFTIHYHEVTTAVQAFSDFYANPDKSAGMSFTMTPGQDNFAINYGTGGIGAEVLANRIGVGPMWNCTDCRFEEFFLASWAVGDPAMVVNKSANFPAGQPAVTNPNGALPTSIQQMAAYAAWNILNGQSGTAPPLPAPPAPGQKATQVFFADDPSNVYHSYLQDHVKFRVLHAGSNLTHIHHQHAHQWMHTPNDPNSSYLDSQLISPGQAYTLEIDYNGGGNRNQTLGDSIFHCHFYPHFAAGMWSLWRVHDVFEGGTQLSNGVPISGARALPDGEIATGAPIPAVVPLPTKAMAPIPAKVQIVPVMDPKIPTQLDGYAAKVSNQCDRMDGKNIGTCTNPGFPFFVPGVGGHRAPAPPLDFAPALTASGAPITKNGQQVYLDGGLARHVILSGTESIERHNQWDFTKEDSTLTAVEVPEDGTPVEKAAIAYNGTRNHPSYMPDGQSGTFITNGLPRGPQPGAPFADPAVDDQGNPTGTTVRRYKAADIQTDVVFNKKGWHYPQERFLTLWSDVKPTVAGTSAPEPFFFRANSKSDIIEYWYTNLVPNYYELDDFQVRTPTDIIGQHIHLVKFDVLASDGAANGYNYEDGTLSPSEVVARIDAIRKGNNCTPTDPRNGTFTCPVAKDPTPANGYPIDFGTPPPGQSWKGASTTIQRWYPDPLVGCPWPPCSGSQQTADRTLRTVFTHDHFGPSTHQQAGLYAGLVVEPQGSTWLDPETGSPYGGAADGGPTSWQANIIAGSGGADSYREFNLEFQDLALAYDSSSRGSAVPYPANPPVTITPTTTPWGWVDCTASSGDTHAINSPAATSRGGNGCKINNLAAGPTLISGGVAQGTMSVNYRNEPVPFRVSDPKCPPPGTGCHNTANPATDLSYAFMSMNRLDTALNTQPKYPQPIDTTGQNNFKFPPALLSCANCVQGNDPYTPMLRAFQNDRVQVRVLVGAHLFNHNFGIEGVKWLFEPSASTSGYRDNQAMGISEHYEMQFTVPTSQATTADFLYMPGSGVNDLAQGLWGIMRTYNANGNPGSVPSLKPLPNNPGGGVALKSSASCPANATGRQTYNVAAIYNPTGLTYNSRDAKQFITNAAGAMLYVFADASGKPLTTTPRDPLVLRARAGECVLVNLFNALPASNAIFTTSDGNAPSNLPTADVPLFPSSVVGMHSQLLSYDVSQNNGVNVGINPLQTIGPCQSGQCAPRQYVWYAGNVVTNPDGTTTGIPIELGSANLIASDPLEQQPLAMIGALIVEPPGSRWSQIVGSNVMVDVNDANSNFAYREFVSILQNNVYLTQNAFNAMNFGSEPMSYRFMNQGGNSPSNFDTVDVSQAFSNNMMNPFNGLPQGEPQTQIYCAKAGTAVRFRNLHPDGLGGFPDDVWTLHGHVWQEEPYVSSPTVNSVALGNNPNSEWFGARDGFGPGNKFDVLIDKAGGTNGIKGDYLFKSVPVGEFSAGNWGIMRVYVTDPEKKACEAAASTPHLAAPAAALVSPETRFLARQKGVRPKVVREPVTGMMTLEDRFSARHPQETPPPPPPQPKPE